MRGEIVNQAPGNPERWSDAVAIYWLECLKELKELARKLKCRLNLMGEWSA
jgi:hypothetical protein